MPTRKARAILSGFHWDSIHNSRVFHEYLVDDMLKLGPVGLCSPRVRVKGYTYSKLGLLGLFSGKDPLPQLHKVRDVAAESRPSRGESRRVAAESRPSRVYSFRASENTEWGGGLWGICDALAALSR